MHWTIWRCWAISTARCEGLLRDRRRDCADMRRPLPLTAPLEAVKYSTFAEFCTGQHIENIRAQKCFGRIFHSFLRSRLSTDAFTSRDRKGASSISTAGKPEVPSVERLPVGLG